MRNDLVKTGRKKKKILITVTGNSSRIRERRLIYGYRARTLLHGASVVRDYWRGTRCRVELSQLSANIQKLVYRVTGNVYWQPAKCELYERANSCVTVGYGEYIGRRSAVFSTV